MDTFELATRTAQRLAKLVRTDGTFTYKYDPLLQQTLPGYNVLRHAGCVWALNLAQKRGILELDRAARLAMNWLIANCVVRGSETGLCIIDQSSIKLGGNALAILALTSLPDFSKKDRKLVKDLCRYIWAQMDDDGNFVHKRDAATNKIDPFRSAYYDGEALFALLAAAEKEPDLAKVGRLRTVILSYTRRGFGIKQQSHWMMYAVEACQNLAPHPELMDYAEKLTDEIVFNPINRLQSNCTMLACNSEALLAYLRMATSGRALARGRQRIAWSAIEENILFQVKAMLPDGAFRRSHDDGPVRIDYLQHNLISLLGHAQLRVRDAF